MAEQDEKIWLVRAGHKILGPYSKQQIEELISSRDVVGIDEVSRPNKRWRYLRDLPEFAYSLEARRNSDSNINEETHTSFSANKRDDEVTQAVWENQHQETTYKPPADEETTFLKVRDVRSLGEETVSTKNSAASGVKSFGTSSDAQVYHETNKASRWAWLLVATIAMSTAGYFAYIKFLVEPEKAQRIFDDSLRSGIQAYDLGLYPQAYQELSKVSIEKPSTDLARRLSPLLIFYGGQTVQARRLMDEVGNKIESKFILNIFGMSYLREQDVRKANDFFQASMKQDPDYLPARLNSIIANILLKNYGLAQQQLGSVLSQSNEDGIIAILNAEVSRQIWLRERNPNIVSEAKKFLQDFLTTSHDYRQEAMIYLLYFESESSNPVNFKPLLTSTLDSDPQMSQDHIHSALVYRTPWNWNSLGQICANLKMPDGGARLQILLAYCSLLSEDLVKAKSGADLALSQAPKDPLVQGIYSFILQKGGQEEEAAVLLDQALKNDVDGKFKLPLILKARTCEERGDFGCSMEYWKKVLLIDSNYLPAVTGLAKAQWKTDRRDEARKVVSYLGPKVGHYRPLVLLKREIDGL